MQTLSPAHIDSPKQLQSFIDMRKDEAVKEAKATAVRIAKTEMKLAEFELLYTAVVDKKHSKKNLMLLKKDRDAQWKEALKRANGDEEKAIFIYDEM